eukprot:754065-Hanusia_phi.AAC.1
MGGGSRSGRVCLRIMACLWGRIAGGRHQTMQTRNVPNIPPAILKSFIDRVVVAEGGVNILKVSFKSQVTKEAVHPLSAKLCTPSFHRLTEKGSI